jgi:hypothetical protein
MKLCFLLVFLVTVVAAFADDAIKIVSPDNTTTLVVDKSGKRDLIILHSGKIRHRLFYEDLDTLFRAKLATAFNASLNKVGKVDDFGFTAVVSKTGRIKDLSITPGIER